MLWHMLFRAALSLPSLFATMVDSTAVPRLLPVIKFHATSLETWTKESNMCVSLRVVENRRHNKSKDYLQLMGDLLLRGSTSLTDLFYS